MNKMEEQKYLIDTSSFNIVKHIKALEYNEIYLVHDDKEQKDLIVDTHFYSLDKKEEKHLNQSIKKLHYHPDPTLINIVGYSNQCFGIRHSKKCTSLIYDSQLTIPLINIFHDLRKGIEYIEFDITTRFIILTGVAYGMMHFYKQEVGLHGLRPTNIFLDEHLHPKILLEFNLPIKSIEKHPEMQFPPMDELIYVPLLDLNDKSYVASEKLDVYSFGMIAYETITEIAPFSIGNPQVKKAADIINRMKKGDIPEFFRPTSPSLKSMIRSCWSRNPEDRPSFEEIFRFLAYNLDKAELLDDFDYDKFNSYVNSISKN